MSADVVRKKLTDIEIFFPELNASRTRLAKIDRKPLASALKKQLVKIESRYINLDDRFNYICILIYTMINNNAIFPTNNKTKNISLARGFLTSGAEIQRPRVKL